MNIIQIYFINYMYYYLKDINYLVLHLNVHYMINHNYLINFSHYIDHMVKIFKISSLIIINFNKIHLIINFDPRI